MPKPRRPSATGWYHAIARGNNRQPVFLEKTDCQRFLIYLEQYRKLFSVAISHYCLMPNHVHLLIFSEKLESLSKYLHRVNLIYSWWYRKRYTFCGHLWQGRYHSFPIESESYLLEAGRYIERNPFQAGMVQDLMAYPWSSYRWYAYGETGEVDLTISPGYLAMGKTPQTRQGNYRLYVSTHRPYDLAMGRKLSAMTTGA